MSQPEELRAGDPIWFAQACRGGYGFQRDVPGEFVKVSRTRVTVLVYRKPGDPVQVVVHPRNVRRRHVEA